MIINALYTKRGKSAPPSTKTLAKKCTCNPDIVKKSIYHAFTIAPLYRLFRDNPNLWADLSAGSAFYAMTRDKENAIKFINEFQDRLMYATDICTAGKMYSMDSFLLELKNDNSISEATFRKLARENAIQLLNLKNE